MKKNIPFITLLLATIGLLNIYSCSNNQTNQSYSWVKMTNPTNSMPFSFQCFFQDGANLFTGTDFNGVFISTNNGSSWTTLNSGIKTTPFGHETVYALIKSGSNLLCGSEDGVYVSSNNGTNWSAVLGSVSVRNFAIINASTVLASTNSGIYVSSNNGMTWSASNTGLTSPFVSTPPISSILVNGQYTYASANGGGVFLSTNNGINWTAINTGLSSNIINATNAAAFDFLASIGSTIYAFDANYDVLYKTVNNGANWNLVNFSTGAITDIVSDGLNLYTINNSGDVFKSIDNGNNWTIIGESQSDFGWNRPENLAISGGKLFAFSLNGGSGYYLYL